MPPLTRNQAREVDRFAIDKIGIPGLILMENAGRSAAEALLAALADRGMAPPGEARVVIVCGGGNNGGDGYVMARHLHRRGAGVVVYAATDPARLTGDAAVNHRTCENLGLDIRPLTDAASLDAESAGWERSDAVVDALLGTGFTGEVRPHMAAVIRRLNALRGPLIVAVDVPSGLDCDTGHPGDATIRADLTVTFVDTKRGFASPEAALFLGQVVIADIAIPADAVARALDAPSDPPRPGRVVG